MGTTSGEKRNFSFQKKVLYIIGSCCYVSLRIALTICIQLTEHHLTWAYIVNTLLIAIPFQDKMFYKFSYKTSVSSRILSVHSFHFLQTIRILKSCALMWRHGWRAHLCTVKWRLCSITHRSTQRTSSPSQVKKVKLTEFTISCNAFLITR